MSRLRHAKSFTKGQLKLHKRMGHQLQRANAIAAECLIKLNRLRPDQRGYERVQSNLAGLARWMNFLIECCEQIVASGWQGEPARFVLTITRYCKNCLANGRYENRMSHFDGQPETLEADPAWRLQVGVLLSLTTYTIGRTFDRACSAPSELQKLPRCLADLTDALFRQLRHLEQMDGGQKMEMVLNKDRSEICSVCGRRKSDEPLTDNNVEEPEVP